MSNYNIPINSIFYDVWGTFTYFWKPAIPFWGNNLVFDFRCLWIIRFCCDAEFEFHNVQKLDTYCQLLLLHYNIQIPIYQAMEHFIRRYQKFKVLKWSKKKHFGVCQENTLRYVAFSCFSKMLNDLQVRDHKHPIQILLFYFIMIIFLNSKSIVILTRIPCSDMIYETKIILCKYLIYSAKTINIIFCLHARATFIRLNRDAIARFTIRTTIF